MRNVKVGRGRKTQDELTEIWFLQVLQKSNASLTPPSKHLSVNDQLELKSLHNVHKLNKKTSIFNYGQLESVIYNTQNMHCNVKEQLSP